VPTIRFNGEIQACLKQATGFRRFYFYRPHAAFRRGRH